MIPGLESLAEIERSWAVHPVTAILGPRRCGKTTLARQYARGRDVRVVPLREIVGALRG